MEEEESVEVWRLTLEQRKIEQEGRRGDHMQEVEMMRAGMWVKIETTVGSRIR